MCSCHAALNRSGVGASAPSGPATAELRRDHDLILGAVTVLERVGDRLEFGPPVSESALTELVQLIRTFADRCHQGKEEGQLFPALQAKGLSEVLAVFLGDHDTGRRYLTTLASAVPAAERALAARRYVGLMRDHIRRENDLLFPMAERALSAEEQGALARAYETVEQAALAPGGHEDLVASLERLTFALVEGMP